MTEQPPSPLPAITRARKTSMGWHIQRLAAQLDQAMTDALKPHGLTLQGFALVMTALEFDGLTQSQLCARFSAPAYAITRSIDHLARDGFLERRIHPSSRRSNTVHATQKARDLAPQLLAIINDVNGRLGAALTDPQAKTLLALLQTTLANNRLL